MPIHPGAGIFENLLLYKMLISGKFDSISSANLLTSDLAKVLDFSIIGIDIKYEAAKVC